jgi:membrane protein DedA with SNARE-associated domain
MESVFTWLSHYGYPALFGLLVLGIVGLPVPDETLLVFCGYLIWKGKLEPAGTFLAAFGGSVCGISLSYFIGRTYGHKVTHRYGRVIGFTPERLDRVHRWFERIGTWLLTVGYFIPGVRHFTALVAGTAELQWPVFALFAYSGAALWVTVFLTLGYAVGDRWEQTSSTFHKYALFATLLAVLVSFLVWAIRRNHRPRP